MDRILALQQFYARFVTAVSGVEDERICQAFSVVRREDYLPPGPWQVYVPDGYIETANDDPAQLYQNILIALDADRGINNGEPALHARCLDAVAPQPGETVLHIGCGTGYYTALLATLVGDGGRVKAIEVIENLATQAKTNLTNFPHVQVSCRSGTSNALPSSDVIYVNAGATEPTKIWLDALKPAGRLIFPLTPGWGYGGMLLVTRPKTGAGFSARVICRAAFTPCVGAQTESLLVPLAAAFEDGSWREVRSLHVGGNAPDESCWLAGHGWWLSTAIL